MSIKCDVCAKTKMHGHRIKHKHSKGWKYRAPNTLRVWLPNLRKVKITLPGTKKVYVVKMCMSCYKKYSVEGLDFIKAKSPRLYKKILKAAKAQ